MDTPGTLIEFMEAYRSEEDCRATLFRHRWPRGFSCPRCGNGDFYAIEDRGTYECRACRHQTSLTAGTVLHRTRTPLVKWFLAIYLLSSTKKAFPAAELSRQLGLSHHTAWLMRRKIVAAMTETSEAPLLGGVVEVDESFIGGYEKGVRGRGSKKKSMVAVFAEEGVDGSLALAHMRIIPDATRVTLHASVTAMVAPGSVVKTDGHTSYWGLKDLGYVHENKVSRLPDDPCGHLPWVHTVVSNLKRWILGTFHGVSGKHLQSYLDEFCYRLNRRFDRGDLFRRVLNRCASFFGPVTYAEFTAPELA